MFKLQFRHSCFTKHGWKCLPPFHSINKRIIFVVKPMLLSEHDVCIVRFICLSRAECDCRFMCGTVINVNFYNM